MKKLQKALKVVGIIVALTELGGWIGEVQALVGMEVLGLKAIDQLHELNTMADDLPGMKYEKFKCKGIEKIARFWLGNKG